MPLRFPKGRTRKQQRAEEKRLKAAQRKTCAALVYQQANGRCQDCDRAVLFYTDPAATEWNIGLTHEVIPRSLGGDPTDPANCRLLCIWCHARAHGLRVR